MAMRQRFESQLAFQLIPIQRIVLPIHSRDELPPILAGLQWIWCHPALREEIFQLLEGAILAGKKATGRPGMELWQILVLGVVRLGLDADWDRMEHLANYDLLLRQMLGVPTDPWGTSAAFFQHQTLRDNVALLNEAVLREINARVAAAGREVFHKKGGPSEALALKVDTYVLETDVHFPTDLNLLFDAGRKCLDLIEKYRAQCGYELPGWRKLEDWQRRFKTAERVASKAVFGGGKDKEKRVRAAVAHYLETGFQLSAKVTASLLSLCDQPVDQAHWESLAYFQGMLDKHIDLVDRRLLREEKIPAAEKIYSLFEPHTEWINKGKLHPSVELGHRLLIATDQHQLIQDYGVPVGGADVDQSIPVASRLLGRYGDGAIRSISFDKGFTRREDRELLSLYIPEVIMPKRGKKNAEEIEREGTKKFVALRRQHSAVESQINALEHHGLNRCLDVGMAGYLRYVGYGVLAYNLHQIGRELLCRQQAKTPPLKMAA
jgi:IS5 family transposase